MLLLHVAQELDSFEQLFLYLPLMHSEKLADQQRCLHIVSTSEGVKQHADFAASHLNVVERFGRFPHRNAMLGRESSVEEQEWLDSDERPKWARI